MLRNLKFWSRYALESMGTVLVALGVLFLLVGYGKESALSLLEELPYILFIAAAFISVLLNCTAQILYFPLLVSVGETRHTVFTGYQITRAAILGISILLCALLQAFSAQGVGDLPVLATALLLITSVGGIMGTLFIKVRWLGMVLLTLFFSAIGGISGYLASGHSLGRIAAAMSAASVSQLLWLMLTTAVLLSFDLAFHWLVLRKQEFKL